jgi:tetratricopeptide (TPR) repeat protein
VDDEQELPDVSAILPLAEELIALFPHDANDGAEADGREHAVDDAQDADEESPTEDVDTEDVDTEDVDTEDVDTEDADTEDADTWLEHSALELEPAALSAALDVATRLARALEGDSERLLALEEITHSDLLAMLADLPLALAQAGRVEDGVELGRVLAFLDPPYFGSERARLLANAGRHDEALAQLVQNLQAPTRDGWVEVEAADVYAQLGDAARAEALLQSVVERSREAQVRDVAFDRLLELLDSQGRHREVKAMLSAERARLDDLVKPTPRTVQNVTPKVGRNDPCPCGSGKKHKKCCLV